MLTTYLYEFVREELKRDFEKRDINLKLWNILKIIKNMGLVNLMFEDWQMA